MWTSQRLKLGTRTSRLLYKQIVKVHQANDNLHRKKYCTLNSWKCAAEWCIIQSSKMFALGGRLSFICSSNVKAALVTYGYIKILWVGRKMSCFFASCAEGKNPHTHIHRVVSYCHGVWGCEYSGFHFFFLPKVISWWVSLLWLTLMSKITWCSLW